MRGTSRHVLRKMQNDILTGLANSLESSVKASRMQVQYLRTKVASKKKRRNEISQKLKGSRPIRLLLADPEDSMLSVANELGGINGTSFEMFRASSVEEARKLLEDHEFDIVLLSCKSLTKCALCTRPGQGLGAMVRALRKARKVPVIVYSKNSHHGCDLEAMESGASDFLSEDELDPRRLEKAIRYCLAKDR